MRFVLLLLLLTLVAACDTTEPEPEEPPSLDGTWTGSMRLDAERVRTWLIELEADGDGYTGRGGWSLNTPAYPGNVVEASYDPPRVHMRLYYPRHPEDSVVVDGTMDTGVIHGTVTWYRGASQEPVTLFKDQSPPYRLPRVSP